MSEYGLTSLRDADGELQAVDHSYEWGGQEVTIKFVPPTLSQQEQLEDLDDDAAADKLEELLDRHMVKPSVPENESWTAREMWCYITGIMRWSMGEDGGLGEELESEIDERTGEGQGN